MIKKLFLTCLFAFIFLVSLTIVNAAGGIGEDFGLDANTILVKDVEVTHHVQGYTFLEFNSDSVVKILHPEYAAKHTTSPDLYRPMYIYENIDEGKLYLDSKGRIQKAFFKASKGEFYFPGVPGIKVTEELEFKYEENKLLILPKILKEHTVFDRNVYSIELLNGDSVSKFTLLSHSNEETSFLYHPLELYRIKTKTGFEDVITADFLLKIGELILEESQLEIVEHGSIFEKGKPRKGHSGKIRIKSQKEGILIQEATDVIFTETKMKIHKEKTEERAHPYNYGESMATTYFTYYPWLISYGDVDAVKKLNQIIIKEKDIVINQNHWPSGFFYGQALYLEIFPGNKYFDMFKFYPTDKSLENPLDFKEVPDEKDNLSFYFTGRNYLKISNRKQGNRIPRLTFIGDPYQIFMKNGMLSIKISYLGIFVSSLGEEKDRVREISESVAMEIDIPKEGKFIITSGGNYFLFSNKLESKKEYFDWPLKRDFWTGTSIDGSNVAISTRFEDNVVQTIELLQARHKDIKFIQEGSFASDPGTLQILDAWLQKRKKNNQFFPKKIIIYRYVVPEYIIRLSSGHPTVYNYENGNCILTIKAGQLDGYYLRSVSYPKYDDPFDFLDFQIEKCQDLLPHYSDVDPYQKEVDHLLKKKMEEEGLQYIKEKHFDSRIKEREEKIRVLSRHKALYEDIYENYYLVGKEPPIIEGGSLDPSFIFLGFEKTEMEGISRSLKDQMSRYGIDLEEAIYRRLTEHRNAIETLQKELDLLNKELYSMESTWPGYISKIKKSNPPPIPFLGHSMADIILDTEKIFLKEIYLSVETKVTKLPEAEKPVFHFFNEVVENGKESLTDSQEYLDFCEDFLDLVEGNNQVITLSLDEIPSQTIDCSPDYLMGRIVPRFSRNPKKYWESYEKLNEMVRVFAGLPDVFCFVSSSHPNTFVPNIYSEVPKRFLDQTDQTIINILKTGTPIQKKNYQKLIQISFDTNLISTSRYQKLFGLSCTTSSCEEARCQIYKLSCCKKYPLSPHC